MNLVSVFRHPEGGVMAGIATAVAVYLIYQNALPSGADVRMGPANDEHLDAVRQSAALKSAGLVGLVFLVTRDLNTFIISGAAVGGIDYMYKHQNALNPHTGKLEGKEFGAESMSNMASVHPLPDYSQDAEEYA